MASTSSTSSLTTNQFLPTTPPTSISTNYIHPNITLPTNTLTFLSYTAYLPLFCPTTIVPIYSYNIYLADSLFLSSSLSIFVSLHHLTYIIFFSSPITTMILLTEGLPIYFEYLVSVKLSAYEVKIQLMNTNPLAQMSYWVNT